MDDAVEAAIVAETDAIGFEDRGFCDASALVVDERVRAMCAADRCHHYGKSWACPPGCGPIESFQSLIDERRRCAVLQTVRELEDDYDVEMMMEADAIQKERVAALTRRLRERGIDHAVLSSGACTLCGACTYPDEPCRMPERRLTSMEAAGLNVTETCNAAAVPYNHGPRTITYTACILY